MAAEAFAVEEIEVRTEPVGPYADFAPAEMIHAIEVAHGIAEGAAQWLTRNFASCSRKTVFNYIERYPEVAAAYEEQRHRNVDFAEQEQLKALKAGERWLKHAEAARDEGLLNAIQIVIPDNTRDAGMIDVDVQTVDEGGDGRPPANIRHQRRIQNLWGVETKGLPD